MQSRRHPKPPVASRSKRILHALYLAQPFLQFVALMVVLFTLGRCSPLAPSERGGNQVSASNAVTDHTRGANAEEGMHHELKDVALVDELPLLTQNDFAAHIQIRSISPDSAADSATVQNYFQAREHQAPGQRAQRLLVLRLSPAQKDAFFQNGSARVSLKDALERSMDAKLRRDYFTEIHKVLARGDLGGKVYLVAPDDLLSIPEAAVSVPVKAAVQLAISEDDQQAWIQLNRRDSNSPLDEQQQKLIESAKAPAITLAIALE